MKDAFQSILFLYIQKSMSLLSIDLGGTKLAVGVFDENGQLLFSKEDSLGGRKGKEVGELISENIISIFNSGYSPVEAIGIAVPGISNSKNGTVWAPNIPGWDNYPLLEEIRNISGDIPVSVESDRSCYILGEMWQGNAKGTGNAIFLAVGTVMNLFLFIKRIFPSIKFNTKRICGNDDGTVVAAIVVIDTVNRNCAG